MDALATALGPAFAAGFALQQLLEILDPLVEKIARDWKKMFLALVSLAFGAGIRVLVHLGYTGVDLWDAVITAPDRQGRHGGHQFHYEIYGLCQG